MPVTPSVAVLAFDFGEKRIGVATGETVLGIAHPLTTIASEIRDVRFGAIEQLIAEWQPAQLVVGLPLHMDGTEHEMTQRCRRFARQLEGRFKLPVALVDERLTSEEAEDMLAEQGRRGRQHKHLIDQVAAQRILQAWLDQQQSQQKHP
jgi:putative holliday junction resolvase